MKSYGKTAREVPADIGRQKRIDRLGPRHDSMNDGRNFFKL